MAVGDRRQDQSQAAAPERFGARGKIAGDQHRRRRQRRHALVDAPEMKRRPVVLVDLLGRRRHRALGVPSGPSARCASAGGNASRASRSSRWVSGSTGTVAVSALGKAAVPRRPARGWPGSGRPAEADGMAVSGAAAS